MRSAIAKRGSLNGKTRIYLEISANLFTFSIILIPTLFPEIFLAKKRLLQLRKNPAMDEVDLGEQ
jgi:hypothetical protein